MKQKLRTTALWASLLVGVVPALQGCFPVVAAGVGAGALMAADRRTSGTYVEDEEIEWKVEGRISDRFGDRVHVNAVSFNRVVLLTGEVPDDTTRSAVQTIAAGVANVRSVVNETVVAGISSLSSRSNDALITSKIKARFVDQATFGVNHVKVYTEAGTVFLMGLVTHKEADAATELARTTSGVRKVVRVFEYITPEEAARIDNLAAKNNPNKNNPPDKDGVAK